MRQCVRRFLTVLAPLACVALAVPATAAGGRSAPRPIKIDAVLSSTGAAPSAAGEAHFRYTGGEGRFDVEVEGLPSGAYELLVAGVVQGEIIVDEMSEGEIRFSSLAPEEGSAEEDEDSEVLLLTFDPRGRILEVARDGATFLQTSFPSRGRSGDRH